VLVWWLGVMVLTDVMVLMGVVALVVCFDVG
jgi:hypothetical protein